MSYYLAGRHLGAEEALELGLVQEVVPHEQLLDHAAVWCERAEAMPRHALEMTKALLTGSVDASWDHSLKLEEFAEANCFSTVDVGQAAERLLGGSAAAADDSR
jgi:2-(1,2-epoxy-1,2-dihydrophenyl)acetyl-CoA isomerase